MAKAKVREKAQQEAAKARERMFARQEAKSIAATVHKELAQNVWKVVKISIVPVLWVVLLAAVSLEGTNGALRNCLVMIGLALAAANLYIAIKEYQNNK